MDRAAIGPRGFTLTEVVIALFLVGMFGVAIGNLDFFAQGTIRRFDRRLWLAQEPRRLFDWMTADVEKAETMEVYGGDPIDWTAPLAAGAPGGNALELTWLEDVPVTPLNRLDDRLHEVRYTWTKFDLVGPPGFGATMPDIVRRYERVTDLPAFPGNWDSSDIVCGLGEERNPGPPTPDTPILKVTGFQVTKTADPGTSQLNPIPKNILRLDVQLTAASSSLQNFQATYYLQSRSLHAWKLRDIFLAFLKKKVP